MAEYAHLSLGWRNILIGVVCVLAANLLLALIETAVSLPGPHWIWSGIAAAIAIVVWFTIAGRLRK